MRKIFPLLLCLLLFTVTVTAETVKDKEISLGSRKGTYSGDFENGLPNGSGRLESETLNGDVERWVGHFENGVLVDGSYFVNGILRAQGTWKNDTLWNGRTYDEEGNPYSSIKDGETMLNYWAFLFIPFVFGFPFVFLGFALFLTKRYRKNRLNSQISLMNAEQELSDRKTINWKCPSCGANNHNSQVFKYCGTGKSV